MSDCHDTVVATPVILRNKTPLIALAGQPNVGKSTLFNQLTGLSQHVGNWPGKTVERREGMFSFDGRSFGLVDLPGTYSLTANSPEEVIAREFILRERPDAVIAVVNASNLERSLYLLPELLEIVDQILAGERSLAARPPEIRADHQAAMDEIRQVIAGYVPPPYPE